MSLLSQPAGKIVIICRFIVAIVATFRLSSHETVAKIDVQISRLHLTHCKLSDNTVLKCKKQMLRIGTWVADNLSFVKEQPLMTERSVMTINHSFFHKYFSMLLFCTLVPVWTGSPNITRTLVPRYGEKMIKSNLGKCHD